MEVLPAQEHCRLAQLAGVVRHAGTLHLSAGVEKLDIALIDPDKTFEYKIPEYKEYQKFERQGKLRAVSFKAGDVRLLISQDDGGTGWDRVKGAGFTLQLTTTQDVDSLAQAIKDRGGWLESEPADESGTRVLRLRDPDGFRLVISAAR